MTLLNKAVNKGYRLDCVGGGGVSRMKGEVNRSEHTVN